MYYILKLWIYIIYLCFI